MKERYQKEENWQGSFFELSLQFPRHNDLQSIVKLFRAVFDQDRIWGPARERTDLDKVSVLKESDISDVTIVYGIAKIEPEVELGISVDLVRTESSDWLSVSFPTGMLESVFRVQYPLDERTNPWISKITDFLISCAREVFQIESFKVGFIGEEVGGLLEENQLKTRDAELGGVLVTEQTINRLKVKAELVKITSGLYYIRPGRMLNVGYKT